MVKRVDGLRIITLNTDMCKASLSVVLQFTPDIVVFVQGTSELAMIHMTREYPHNLLERITSTTSI